jgi:hypothetical protein
MFSRLFGRGREAPAAQLPVVRNITIGRSLKVDPLAWRRFGSDVRFSLDRDTLEVVAQGLIDLGADGFVHRFYTDDEVMFQVLSGDRKGVGSEDHTLFIPWSSAYPSSKADRRRWRDRLEARTFTDEGLPEYRRFWFGEEAETQAPMTLWESVYDDRAMTRERRIYQSCMLFARELPQEGRELLLALEMEPEGGEPTHEVMIGVPLDIAEFSA